MKRKGFTLIELLIVITIIALLMGILMPALNRVRQKAYRMICGSNLSGIGKAMLVYGGDNDEEWPVAGGNASHWHQSFAASAEIANWAGETEIEAFGKPPGADATITSCFYLLLKYIDVAPKSFICKGDTAAEALRLAALKQSLQPDEGFELSDGWDFGPWDDIAEVGPRHRCSYSYQVPFYDYRIDALSDPGMAVAADRNPHIGLNYGGVDIGDDPESFWWTPDDEEGSTPKQQKNGNTICHQQEGSNVLFVDGHTSFETRPYCALNDDNIYTHWDKDKNPSDDERQRGSLPFVTTDTFPDNRKDSLLVNEGFHPE